MQALATPPKKPKFDARAAATSAAAYFKDLYPNVTAFSLEEVELSDDGKYWSITLSFEMRTQQGLGALAFLPPTTKFKVFKVDAKTGRVMAMKIRKLE